MPISDRIESTIERWSTKWGDRLGAWAIKSVAGSVEKSLDRLEPELVKQARAHLEKIRDTPGLPAETRALLTEMLAPKSFAFVLPLLAFLFGLITPLVASMTKGALEPARQQAEKITPFHIPGVEDILGLRVRREISPEEFYDLMSKQGYGKTVSDQYLTLKNVILPTDLVFPAWLRDKGKYQWAVDNLPKLGLSTDTIDLLKELAYKYPSPIEAITWMAHEVFEPEQIVKYGLDDEFDKVQTDFLEKIGITPEMAKKYWYSHWQHASWTQITQMLHRGVLTNENSVSDPPTTPTARRSRDTEGEQVAYDWFRLVEIPPYWRKGLIATAWNVPGRIEARMLAQYGLVDKPFLVELLARDGLAPEYRDVVADMMLVRGIRSDIQTRYAKGWLNAEAVRAEIAKYGLAEGIATRLYQWIVTNGAGDRTAGEKDISKTEIIKAYKQAQIDHAQAVEMLVDLGYDELEADFILAVNAEVPTETPTETQRVSIDTIRRSRRLRHITHDQELAALIALNVDRSLAQAYTDNDDLRLIAVKKPEPPTVVREYQTPAGKIEVDTIRRQRRATTISRLAEINRLEELEMDAELAEAYADNDDLRLIKAP